MKISTSLGTPDISTATPSKALENTCENLRNELGDELFARFKKSSPSVFERAVVELLVKMG